MAKRELIDKTRLLSEKMKKKYYHLTNGDTAIPIIDIEHSTTITEQEILNPYLKAIEAEAIKYSGTGEAEVQAYEEGLWEAIEIIKNLLSEQQK